MLDDIDAALKEAKAEIAHNLELVNCLRKDEGEQAWQKDCLSMFNAGTRNGSAHPNTLTVSLANCRRKMFKSVLK